MSHEKELIIDDNGDFRFVETTRPYGFVDIGAKVWFEKFLDDGITEREYLCTEGYLWTGQYPECQRVVEQGDNQSMELDKKLTKFTRAKLDNSPVDFFIINEAVMSKLCILGEEKEPCFEGSNIKAPKIQFSFEDDFQNQLLNMMQEIHDFMLKGGNEKMEDNKNTQVVDTSLDNSDESNQTNFENNSEGEKVCPECGKPEGECECNLEHAKKKKPEEEGTESKPTEDEKPAEDKKPAEGEKPAEEDEEEKKKKAKTQYNLVEGSEYSALEEKYNTLNSNYETLKSEVETLREFKVAAERKDKQAMINSFTMLGDEEKADVVENIDKYSVDEIESKLAVICVRNKVSFALETEDNGNAETSYNLNETQEDDLMPAWIKAVKDTKNSENL